MIQLAPDIFNKIVDLLLPHVDNERRRHALIDPVLNSHSVYYDIEWGGSPREFSVHLVSLLSQHSKQLLLLLLEETRRLVGDETLINILRDTIHSIPEITAITNVKAEQYIFISYAYEDEVVAEQVKRELEESGFRVFCADKKLLDANNLTVKQALFEADQMVLLLSESSMPYHQKVFQEWYHFYQNSKPIHGLYIQSCSLDNRLYVYHRIDARYNLNDALKQLGQHLIEPFSLVTDIPTHNLLEKYHQDRIAELMQPRYQLDNRFVQLTLLLDQGEETQQARWVPDLRRYNDLRDVLKITFPDNPVLVLLGAPGSGKSTLLRRLQLDESISYLQHKSDKVVFFISLNRYSTIPNSPLPKPGDWLALHWNEMYPDLPLLKELFRSGRVLLLLDALNEMPSRNYDEYLDRIELWRNFLYDITRYGNRIVFSCRTLDYSAVLSGPDLRVPQIEIEPMRSDQIYHFLQVYSPSKAKVVWEYLKSSPQLNLYSRPYFLRLLVEQIEQTQDIPRGSAELFTGFVRRVLQREIEKGNPLFTSSTLLNQRDRKKISLKKWATIYDLPQQGTLIPSHNNLAFKMQVDNFNGEGGQIHIDYDSAEALLNHPESSGIIQAGLALGLLEEDITYGEIAFFHQLLQEYFAARHLIEKPDKNLVQVEWHINRVKPTLAKTIENLASSDSLPLLPGTGWEETTLLAAAMSVNADSFIQSLLEVNLPLAAQCASLPEININDALRSEICQSLISRTENKEADLRARIAAGYALGRMGDPRFKRCPGPFGDYLLPPMINISGGVYSIGSEEGDGYYKDEAPVHDVTIKEFRIGKFPVTNAEYALFIEAGGYENERWWDTPASKMWLRGEESKIQIKKRWRKNRYILQSDIIVNDWLLGRGHITLKEADFLKKIVAMTDDEFETFLNVLYVSGKRQTQPRFWENHSFNNPSQPVVSLCWHEARAYCAWLTAQMTDLNSPISPAQGVFRLPTEVEWEAAASGLEKRRFAFGGVFDETLLNTLEGHIRCANPIGIYPGGETPEGVADLSGNTYEWTSTAYFPYPYSVSDGRENPETNGSVKRVLRGGAFFDEGFRARCACRLEYLPHSSPNYVGFRLVYQNN
jgi:formylglycine-generating enzyme required for sulfatase activity